MVLFFTALAHHSLHCQGPGGKANNHWMFELLECLIFTLPSLMRKMQWNFLILDFLVFIFSWFAHTAVAHHRLLSATGNIMKIVCRKRRTIRFLLMKLLFYVKWQMRDRVWDILSKVTLLFHFTNLGSNVNSNKVRNFAERRWRWTEKSIVTYQTHFQKGSKLFFRCPTTHFWFNLTH